ncbi:PQQ-binding-like beta-propeller repeat protein [Streptomyces sp. NPDC001404]|uniref:outer membrane protein assembly factor BamB family protein n=1 Tax=Streptomyces sp. NPDC001404 TaxID=3364571 RepID=UPI0036BA4B6B
MRVTKAVMVALAGAVVGWAVLFVTRNYAGSGRCAGGACPTGSGARTGLAFLFVIGGVLALFAAVNWAIGRGGWPRRQVWGVLAPAGLLAGLLPGWLLYDGLTGGRLDLQWSAGRDRPDTAEALGNWAVGSTLVQVRANALTAYATRDGSQRWQRPAPGGESVCAMSDRTSGGTGLVAFGGYLKPCDTVALVNLSDGQPVWQRTTDADPEVIKAADARIALADGTAVVAENGAVRGLAAGDGAERWKRPEAEGCRAAAVGASAARALVVDRCGEALRLSSLNARTGEPGWSSTLPSGKEVHVLSAEPAVVAVDGKALPFDGAGRGRAAIPLALPRDYIGFAARPVTRAAIVGDVLVTAVSPGWNPAPRAVGAYALADGRQVWTRHFDDEVSALALRPDGRLAVLTRNGGGDGTVRPLDVRTGQPAGGIEPLAGEDSLIGPWSVELFPDPHGYVIANRTLTGDYPPALGARR